MECSAREDSSRQSGDNGLGLVLVKKLDERPTKPMLPQE